MPPRKRTTTPPAPAHRARLEEDLTALELVDHRALSDLARALADELDRPPHRCDECGGHEAVDPRIVQRYLDVLTALGIGEIPPRPEADPFTQMLLTFNQPRKGVTP